MLMEMARMSTDGRARHADPSRLAARPQRPPSPPGLGRTWARHPRRDRVHSQPARAAQRHGSDPRLTLIIYTLDESTYARELAPLAGHYPALRLGPPWWFHDSIEGLTRFRQQTTETAGIYNTAGFNDDTRAFCSIAARHDLSRRVDANFLAGLVSRHIVDADDARQMARALAYEIPKETYRLNGVSRRPTDFPAIRERMTTTNVPLTAATVRERFAALRILPVIVIDDPDERRPRWPVR
jgi:glucuronate isomerase